ncbi:uncharacterized protein LOC134221524 [Armigeres subalbatus]|uniref:uncharacterized protein LOC134221524 n=1 Tax=Armigeres subalbatus TaxID=124917 RepID=UPI002ED5A522
MSSGDPAAADTHDRSDGQNQCIVCNEPNHADRKMVQCDGCDRWFHFRCVGVKDSIEGEDRSFRCTACSVPDPPASTVSTSASMREARIQLEVQRLAEEKRLQEKMQKERGKQEQAIQEMTLRLERERRDKAIREMFALEKEYIQRKYDLLHTQLDDDGDAVSVRSRCNRGAEKVEDWITRNPAVTMSANSGNKPTGLTSQLKPITSSAPGTATATIEEVGQVNPHSASAVTSSMLATLSLPLSHSANASISHPTTQRPPIAQSTMQGNNVMPIVTTVASVQQFPKPSASVDAHNMFVISPTTASMVSFSLPSLTTTQPVSFMPSYGNSFLPQSSLATYTPQAQGISSVTSTSSCRPIVSHTAAPSCLPASGISSMWQPPTHHSTPTSSSSGRRPAEVQYANTQPMCSQVNATSVSTRMTSMNLGGKENVSSASQHVQAPMG